MAEGDDALAALRQDPIGWLSGNALVIFGGGASTGSGALQFRLFKTDKTTNTNKWRSAVRGGNLREVPYWCMGGVKQDPHGPGHAVAATGSAPFAAHYVSMREYKNGKWEDANATHYMLPGNGGSDMMVTSKLNGCTFGIGSSTGGGRLVSHLRPPVHSILEQNVDPAADAQLVSRATTAGFQSLGHTVKATINSTSTEQGTIVAFRTGTTWDFYIQRFQVLGREDYLINSVFGFA